MTSIIRTKFNKRNIISIVFILILFLLMLNDIFSIGILNYFDEITSLFLLFYILAVFIKKKNTVIIFPLTLFSIFFLIGIVSSIFNYSNIGFKNICLDGFMILKPYIFFFFFFFIKDRTRESLIMVRSFAKIMISIIFLSFLIYLFNHNLFSGYDGIHFSFLASFKGNVANWAIIFLSAICLIKQKSNIIFCVMASIIVVATDSGLGLLGIFLALYFLFIKNKIKTNFIIVGLFLIIAIMISWDEINGYLMNTDAPRYLLLFYGIKTALNFLPFGSGFGTYGSYVAASNYSYLYYEYGFNTIYGLSPNTSMFLFDSYYPMIFGEFGFIGAIFYICFIISIWILMKKNIYNSRQKEISFMLLLYFLIMGLGFFVSSSGCCAYLFCLGWVSNYKLGKSVCTNNYYRRHLIYDFERIIQK